MDVVDRINTEYGDGPPWGDGPPQGKLWQGYEFLDEEYPNLSYLERCEIVKADTLEKPKLEPKNEQLPLEAASSKQQEDIVVDTLTDNLMVFGCIFLIVVI